MNQQNQIVIDCENPFNKPPHGFFVDKITFQTFKDCLCPTCWHEMFLQYRKLNFNVTHHYPKRKESGCVPTKDYL